MRLSCTRFSKRGAAALCMAVVALEACKSANGSAKAFSYVVPYERAPVGPWCYEIAEQAWEATDSAASSLRDVVPPKRFVLDTLGASEWNPRARLMRSLMHRPVSTQWGWGSWVRLAPARLTMTWYDKSSAWGQFELIERADTLIGTGFGASGEKAVRLRAKFRAVGIACETGAP
jgi:hypothetical protein